MSTSPGYHAVKTLSQFWSKIDRTLLSPHDELLSVSSAAVGVVAHCLANIGEEYIVHLHGLTLASRASRVVKLMLSGISSTKDVHGVWTDTTTGATTIMTEAVVNGLNSLVAPAGHANSYVLHILVR